MANNVISYVEDLTPKANFVNMKIRIIRVWGNAYKLDMVLIDERVLLLITRNIFMPIILILEIMSWLYIS